MERKTLKVMEGAEGVSLVVVVVVEEDESSRMARSTELIFGFLF